MNSPDDFHLASIEGLRSPDPKVRLSSLLAIRKEKLLGKAIDRVASLLDDPDSRVACQACQLFALHRPKEETRSALPRILEAFRDGGADVRRAASRTLVNLPYRPAVPALMEAVSDRDIEVRRNAVTALMNLGKYAEDALKTIEGVLDDDDPVIRTMASYYIQNLGCLAVPLLPALESAMQTRPESRARYRLVRLAILCPGLFRLIEPFWYLGKLIEDALGLARRPRHSSGS
jgi:HEAT repeat protein